MSEPKRGDKVGVSRAGLTSKRHVVVDGQGIPLGLHFDSGAVHDLKAALPTLNPSACLDAGDVLASDPVAWRRQGLRQHRFPQLSCSVASVTVFHRRGAVRHFQTHREISISPLEGGTLFCLAQWLSPSRIRFERYSFIYHMLSLSGEMRFRDGFGNGARLRDGWEYCDGCTGGKIAAEAMLS